jgi:hypothetical protein
MANNKAY